MIISVLGLGFVGLTTSLGFSELGHKVYGFDINNHIIDMLKIKKIPIYEPILEEKLKKHLDVNFFLSDNLAKAIEKSDVIYFCVGTPYGKDGEADLKYLKSAIASTLNQYTMNRFRVFVIKSTIPPSTTDKELKPFIEKKGYFIGKDLGLANNPEFLREGYAWDDFINTDRIVIGSNEIKSIEMLKKLYSKMNAPVYATNPTTSEFIKYLSNSLLSVLISYANETRIFAEKFGDIDVQKSFEVIHLDKRWNNGSMKSYFYPGVGFGGYCLPKDIAALNAISNKNKINMPILSNTIEINNNMPTYIVQQVINKKKRLNINNLTLGILGLSFKANTDDVRDSSSAKVIGLLNQHKNIDVIVYDPVSNKNFKESFNLLKYSIAESTKDVLNIADIILIMTSWDEFNSIKSHTNKPILDPKFFLRSDY